MIHEIRTLPSVRATGTDGGTRLRRWLPLLGAVVGLALLLVGNLPHGADAAYDAQSDPAAYIDLYTTALEQKIAALCAEVEGVGNVRVAVSLDSGYRRVYAQQEESYILVSSGTSRDAIHLTDQPPAISGVGIVCTGGNDPRVRSRLVGLLCAAFDLGAHQIYIAQAQN